MFFHKKPPHQPGCLAVHIASVVLLFLAFIASVVGVVMAHYDARTGSLVFGTPSASLSLIAFAVVIWMLVSHCKTCMSECEVCVMPPVGKKK